MPGPRPPAAPAQGRTHLRQWEPRRRGGCWARRDRLLLGAVAARSRSRPAPRGRACGSAGAWVGRGLSETAEGGLSLRVSGVWPSDPEGPGGGGGGGGGGRAGPWQSLGSLRGPRRRGGQGWDLPPSPLPLEPVPSLAPQWDRASGGTGAQGHKGRFFPVSRSVPGEARLAELGTWAVSQAPSKWGDVASPRQQRERESPVLTPRTVPGQRDPRSGGWPGTLAAARKPESRPAWGCLGSST